MRRVDEFAYINRTYGLKLQRGTAIWQVSTGRRGTIARTHPGASHYIDIRWDGCPHVNNPKGCGCGKVRNAHGPFHPTDDLTYQESVCQSQT